MSTLFLDTEFNGFGGELISMSLVSDDGREFYEVLDVPDDVDPFVAEYVIPNLNQAAISIERFESKLHSFLRNFDGAEVIADWPADFEHLCRFLTGQGAHAGWKLPVALTMRLVNSPELHPAVPHNALSDACALRDWWISR